MGGGASAMKTAKQWKRQTSETNAKATRSAISDLPDDGASDKPGPSTEDTRNDPKAEEITQEESKEKEDDEEKEKDDAEDDNDNDDDNFEEEYDDLLYDVGDDISYVDDDDDDDDNDDEEEKADDKENKDNANDKKDEMKANRLQEIKRANSFLQTHLRLFKKTRNTWHLYESGNISERDFALHALNVAQTYFDFEGLPISIAHEFRETAGKRLVSGGHFAVFYDMATNYLRTGRYRQKEGGGNASMLLLSASLSVVWNFSDCSSRVRDVMCEDGELLKLLLKNMQELSDPYIQGTLEDRGKIHLLESSMSIFHNIASEEGKARYVRELKDSIEILRPYLDAKDEKLKMTTIATLADIVTEQEAHILSASEDIIQSLLEKLKIALQDENHRAPGAWAASELLRAVKHLSRNVDNTDLLVKKGVFKLLHLGLKSTEESERKGSIESLWWLSFKDTVRTALMKETQLLELVLKISKSKDDVCQQAADGIVFQLREELQKHTREDLKAEGNALSRDKPDNTSTSGPRHVMLSYSKLNRDLVLQICNFLQQNKIEVWIDIFNMADTEDSTSQAMAEAVEGSVVFLMCYSEHYKNSQFCKQEAEYASKLKKFVIPVKLQAGYDPKGWLGFLIGNDYFMDFTKPQTRHQNLEKLLRKIRTQYQKASVDEPDGGLPKETYTQPKDLVPLLGDSSHGSMVYSAPKLSTAVQDEKIRQWTENDVKKWMDNFKLDGEIRPMTGMEVAFLHQMKSEAPQVFYRLLKSHMNLTKVFSMAKLNFALEKIPEWL